MKSKLLLEFEEKPLLPDGNEKVQNFIVIFHYLHFSIYFGGNNPHYPIIII